MIEKRWNLFVAVSPVAGMPTLISDAEWVGDAWHCVAAGTERAMEAAARLFTS